MHKIVAVTTVLALLIAMPFANAIAAIQPPANPGRRPRAKFPRRVLRPMCLPLSTVP